LLPFSHGSIYRKYRACFSIGTIEMLSIRKTYNSRREAVQPGDIVAHTSRGVREIARLVFVAERI
jgi:hypothetical protein